MTVGTRESEHPRLPWIHATDDEIHDKQIRGVPAHEIAYVQPHEEPVVEPKVVEIVCKMHCGYL